MGFCRGPVLILWEVRSNWTDPGSMVMPLVPLAPSTLLRTAFCLCRGDESESVEEGGTSGRRRGLRERLRNFKTERGEREWRGGEGRGQTQSERERVHVHVCILS